MKLCRNKGITISMLTISYTISRFTGQTTSKDGISESGKYQWIFAKGIGEKIGTYDSDSRTYAIHSIIGDENRDFLYSEIDGFHFQTDGQ